MGLEQSQYISQHRFHRGYRVLHVVSELLEFPAQLHDFAQHVFHCNSSGELVALGL